MFCDKCGKEIKEGNKFCTNCGNSIYVKNYQENNNKKVIKIKFNQFIIGIIAIALIIGSLIIYAIINKNNHQKYVNDTELENKSIINENVDAENSDSEKVYITIDSDVSPTGKEFIGEYSNKLTDVYQDNVSGNASMLKKYYNTSIENIIQFSIENSLRGKKLMETIYYYNLTNNKIIASKQVIYDIKYCENSFKYNNTTTDKFLEQFMSGSVNIFQDAHNDNTSEQALKRFEEYNTYIVNNFSDKKNISFEYNNYKFTYEVSGDVLCTVVTYKNDNNIIEVLMLAHNENNDPQSEIKLWYDKVYASNEITKNNESSDFISEIKNKYPNESNSICTDGDNYWLLTADGEKVYFTDLDSFEMAMEACFNISNEGKTVKNNQENGNRSSNNSSKNNDNYSNSESINSNNEYSNKTEVSQQESTISLADINVKNKSFAEIKSEIEKRGLKVKKEEETKTVSVFDYPKNSEYTIVGYQFKKGDTVTVYETNYIAEEIEMSFVAPTYFEGIGKFYLNSDKTERGVKVYFNDKLVYTGEDEFTYTFKKNEDIKINVIAPYTDESSNVTIINRTITLKELYEKWSSGFYSINNAMYLSFLK